jgi:hypothetical protein
MSDIAAALTSEEVARGEQRAQAWGVTRRIAYATLARTGTQLAECAKSEPEAMLEAYEAISAYLEWRKSETELLEAARNRVLWALGEAHPEALPANAD